MWVQSQEQLFEKIRQDSNVRINEIELNSNRKNRWYSNVRLKKHFSLVSNPKIFDIRTIFKTRQAYNFPMKKGNVVYPRV